jgi:hypothetical protein
LRGRDCSPQAGKGALRFTSAAYAPIYVQSIRCINQSMRLAVGRIIARDPTAVIVMQSDHGSDVGLDWERAQWTWPAQQVRDRFAIFNALRLPPRCRDMVPEDVVAVNTFRIVLACLTLGRPEKLPPRFFITDHRTGEVRPYE